MTKWVIKKVGGGDYSKGLNRINQFIDSGEWTLNSFCEVYDIPHSTASLVERTIERKFLRECKTCNQKVTYSYITNLGNCKKCKNTKPHRSKTKYGTRELVDSRKSISWIKLPWPNQVSQLKHRGVSAAWPG